VGTSPDLKNPSVNEAEFLVYFAMIFAKGVKMDYKKLIDDALYFRRPQTIYTCLATNEAGQELTRQPAEILPLLERIIRETIAPIFAKSKEAHFPGLAHVLGGYLLIGARQNAPQIVDFLQHLPVELQSEAVGYLPIFFKHQGGRYHYDTPLPSEYLHFVKSASQSNVEILRGKALRALSFLCC
jgi:hypothetical protein